MTVEGQQVSNVGSWLAANRMRLLRFFRDSTNLGLGGHDSVLLLHELVDPLLELAIGVVRSQLIG